MSPIPARSRQAFRRAHAETPRTHVPSHRTDVVKAGNCYAGHHTAQGTLVTVTRSGRTKPLDPGYDLGNNSPTEFSWGYNGSGPAQLALAILTDYFGAKPGGSALAEALYEPFKFTVIALLPDRWEMNFEEVGIALCRTLTEEPDRLDRVLSHLESAVLDEFVGCQERNEPLNPADLSESRRRHAPLYRFSDARTRNPGARHDDPADERRAQPCNHRDG
jgi:Family of unknown function (DUF6166)